MRGTRGHKTPNTAHDEASGLHTRPTPDVVEVEVKEVQTLMGTQVFKFAPRTDTDAGSIPAEGGAVGCLAEPEVPRADLLQAALVVEDGGVLAFLTPIITGDTDVVIFGEPFQKVVDLPDLRLLCAEDIGAFVGEDVADDGAALAPAVALLGVGFILVADVVRPDEKLLRLHTEDGDEAKSEGE